jgi:hypothetical protein
MLLEDLKRIHYSFKVGDYYFKAKDFEVEPYTVTFSVQDSGGLEVGCFSVEFDSQDDNLEYDDSICPGTLERLRKTGETDAIVRNVRKTVNSVLTDPSK